MATASANGGEKAPSSSASNRPNFFKFATPHLIAIVAQAPMFVLFFRQMMSKTHYQTIWLAIIATAAIVWTRWPRDERVPYRESVASNVLLILGLIMGLGSIAFVDTWFCAASMMLLITSLLLKIADTDRGYTLWTAALPLFVFLPLPDQNDTRLITALQRHSAWLTSRLLDLVGLGHYLDGTKIQVPGKPGYGIEEACSGVQSFFTLLFIAVVMMVVFRRVKTNLAGGTIFALIGVACIAASIPLPFMLYVGIAFILWSLLGLRATALVFAAVFWAMFINVIRILVIPILDVNGYVNLTHGIGHILLGWGALAIGLLMMLSTDQLLLFLFGPVETEMGESGPLGKLITRFWNQLVSGSEIPKDSDKKKKKKLIPVTESSTRFAWIIAIILGVGGLWQLTDVFRGLQATHKVQVFDADITQPMAENDLPKQLDNWVRVEKGGYISDLRDRGSDLGRRSDSWRYRASSCNASISLDQTFPGWHELTTCYRNSNWKLVDRIVLKPKAVEGEPEWDIVKATFTKDTGQRGYLLFSHFNGAGVPEVAPVNIDSIQAILVKIKNRLSNRIRGSLFSSETYQVQVFVEHYSELSEATEKEITDRYITARKLLREKFLERSADK